MTSTEAAVNQTIRPIAASSIYGIVFHEGFIWAIDSHNGYLLKIDPKTNNTKVLNTYYWSDFIGATGLAITKDILWFTNGECIYCCSLITRDFEPQLFLRISDDLDGIAVRESTIYLTSQKQGKILVFDRDRKTKITHFYAPGIGVENITIKGEELWLTDTLEQTVYCLDRATGETIFSVLTPFGTPTGLTFNTDDVEGKKTLYIAYADREVYIRDNPNAEPNYELQYRDCTFIHPLHFHYNEEKKYALSNGYLVEMTYTEEVSPLDPVIIKDLQWRIALPAETDRQKIRDVKAIGLPFTEEVKNGQRIAIFDFNDFNEQQRYIFGWQATLEVWSIKYQLKPNDCEKISQLEPEFQQKYLADNDNLAMDTEIIKQLSLIHI